MAKRLKGLFIVLEGPDRSGKSTQARLLVQWLSAQGLSVVHTREPGGTPFAEAIRSILLDPVHHVLPMSELMLYEAARAQHTGEKIVPALEKGAVVVCERYVMSSCAYQGYGRKLDMKKIRALNDIATGGLQPDITLVFDMPDKQFTVRGKTLPSDRLEREPAEFRARVRRGFKAMAKVTKGAVSIDAGGNPQEVAARVCDKILKLKKLNRLLPGRRK